MRLGIFGGTFDPVHLGHLILAECVREECRLDEVWFVPALIAPQKLGQTVSTPKDRLDMLRLAVAGHASFRVSELEIQRPGPSFTVETLMRLASTRTDAELFLLVGADSLADFITWREPLEILKLATLIAVNRGRTPADADALFKSLGPQVAPRVHVVSMPAVDISATVLRERVAAGRSIRYQTPRAVELYIQEHGLYRDKSGRPAPVNALGTHEMQD